MTSNQMTVTGPSPRYPLISCFSVSVDTFIRLPLVSVLSVLSQQRERFLSLHQERDEIGPGTTER